MQSAVLSGLALGTSPVWAEAKAQAEESTADPVRQWHAEIAQASARFGIPQAWIERVMRAESGGQTHLDGRPVTSAAGAMGLMQVMPATWAMLRLRLGLGPDPYQPRDNILAGTAYMRAMYDRFGYPGLFAAYNAGPARYAAHLASGRPLPRETQAYLAKVTGVSSGREAGEAIDPPIAPPIQRAPPLFVAGKDMRGPAVPEDSQRSGLEAGAASNTLFVIRRQP